jgi:hypothetical protein
MLNAVLAKPFRSLDATQFLYRQLRCESPDEESVGRLFSEDFEELAHEVLQTERDTVIELRNEEAINDQALRRIQGDIDLAEARLQRPAR